MKSLNGVILFTVLEIVTLVLWLILAGVPFAPNFGHVLAVIVLAGGLFVEHYVSLNVGRGRPAFGPLE